LSITNTHTVYYIMIVIKKEALEVRLYIPCVKSK